MEKAQLNTKKSFKKMAPIGKSSNKVEIVYTQTQVQELNHEELIQRRIIAQQKYSPEASVFKMLRTKVLKQLRKNNWNSLAVTGATQGAGKSMVAVNLAIAMAMEVNQTILLVDLDLKYPKIHWYFDFQVKVGLKDYILSDIPLSDILINPAGIDRLVVLPGRGEAAGSSEMVSGLKMQELADEIKKRYKSRIIIFDMPPVLAADDVLASMDYYDSVLLVVEDGGNTEAEIKKSIQMLSGTNLLGTVLNKSENPPDHQSYY
ncbi:MAG: AAA family ATPase [Methylococcales bacterium]|nr:AAA family ATPase [Methylococcales bacterium]